MANLKVYHLPKSTDESVLIAQSIPVKNIRLRSLLIDPRNFHSKYETEVNQPLEFWLDRLRNQHAQHFVAVASDGPPSEALVLDDKTEFKVFMVVLDEVKQTQTEEGHHKAIGEEDPDKLPTYFLAALWVDPSLRGQGAGSMVIGKSIEWIKNDARKASLKKVRYRVSALDGNDRAVNLYSRLGFCVDQVKKKGDFDDDDDDDVYTEMSMIIEIE